jgi:hypothetical protein
MIANLKPLSKEDSLKVKGKVGICRYGLRMDR